MDETSGSMDGSQGFHLEGSAPQRYEQFVRPVMEPFVQVLLESVVTGDRTDLLDLACGTGFVARAVSAVAGPDATLVGVDLNPMMLRTAASVSDGVAPPIRWVEGSAQELPFADGEFDAVVCQQGLQFFPDLDGAASEIARVARPGGRVAATVWAPMGHSPFMEAQYRSVEHILGTERSAPLARAFACSAQDLISAFESAGLSTIATREVVTEIHLPELAVFARGHLAALPWGAVLAASREDGIGEAADGIVERLGPRVRPDGSATLAFASTLVTATR